MEDFDHILYTKIIIKTKFIILNKSTNYVNHTVIIYFFN